MSLLSKVRVRAAHPSEAAALTGLIRRSKAAWGYPEPWLRAWEAALAISAEYIARERVVLLAEAERLLGFYALELDSPLAILEHLWVDPDYMRRGLGSRLLQLACDAARARGHEYLELIADPNAEPFYLRHGGIRVGVQHGEVLGQPRILPRIRLRA